MLPIEVQIQMEMGRPCHSTPFQGLLLPSLPPPIPPASSIQHHRCSDEPLVNDFLWALSPGQANGRWRHCQCQRCCLLMLPQSVLCSIYLMHIPHSRSRKRTRFPMPPPVTFPLSTAQQSPAPAQCFSCSSSSSSSHGSLCGSLRVKVALSEGVKCYGKGEFNM